MRRFIHHTKRLLRFTLRIVVPGIAALLALSLLYNFLSEHIYNPWRSSAASSTAAALHTADAPQGWSGHDRLWFYTTTQGSDLVPYDFYLALQRADTATPLYASENMARYHYLPQQPDKSRNPDGLPVGFVKDSYKGRNFIGLTCAACHTGQITYKGKTIRIDGGPGGADFEAFSKDLEAALGKAANFDAAGCKDDTCKRFVAKVLGRHGDYSSEKAVLDDLKIFSDRITAYNLINQHGSYDYCSPSGSGDTANTAYQYGYGRLDAFGRIFNRVLEHIQDWPHLRDHLRVLFDEQELRDLGIDVTAQSSDLRIETILSLPKLRPAQRDKVLCEFFNPPNAPVSYPFLWDIPQHDYVQWNGLAANAGLGAVGRNAGEVEGVFGTLDWTSKDEFSTSALIDGQPLNAHLGFCPIPHLPVSYPCLTFKHISFESSIRVHNLRRIEELLKKLQSPVWRDDILGAYDGNGAKLGEKIFLDRCARCHQVIDRASNERRIVASMTNLNIVKTDPAMASNSVNYSGFTGFLRNEYSHTISVGDILLNKRAPVAALLDKTTVGVVSDPYPYPFLPRRIADWIYDLLYDDVTNDIKPSIKSGDYDPDTTAKPYASLLAYKGRSLNGIWATAPYLHNGSVPTLYDLLLPKRKQTDPPDGEYRPDKFLVGSREFDPIKVGLSSSGYDGFTFDTQIPGNSNDGHEYGTIHDPDRSKPPLTTAERGDLLEYLKSL